MKKLNKYIQEKLVIGKNMKAYSCKPKDKVELRNIIEERLLNDKDADLNDIDVSQITNMGTDNGIGLFEGLDPHNIKIDKWNVSNVKNMERMFFRCINFNCDLSNWDVSKVENMGSMFISCNNFEDKGLEKWDVSNVEYMGWMFYNCQNLNCDLSNWNISNVENTRYMFNGCINFESKGLEKWDISNIKNMSYMFSGCKLKPSWYDKNRWGE